MRSRKGGVARGVALTLIVFALLFTGANLLLNYIGNESEAAQVKLVMDAVHNSLITCYAVEGRYPLEMEYLKENYGLAYDEDRFIVHCEAFASNVLPDVMVSVKGEAGR